MATLADRLRLAMDQGRWSQARLAHEVGVTQGAVSQILLGNTLRSRYLPDIAEVLGVPLRWLKGEDVASGPIRTAPEEVRPRLYLPVELPSEPALTRMFEALLSGISEGTPPAEQARLLAQRLPIGLAQLQDLRPASARAPRQKEPALTGASPGTPDPGRQR